ncbi:hypothetical protein EVAR_30978_1 [Eumeta japonica]|uniref:Uncharacterized protein n=1 Tax=Eumeta variegata TaxID=151549 RepID=A0A4C1W6E3_EUMVA|nr:hypothetical protein EVAR_30978_1 [Eumeta japonica]
MPNRASPNNIFTAVSSERPNTDFRGYCVTTMRCRHSAIKTNYFLDSTPVKLIGQQQSPCSSDLALIQNKKNNTRENISRQRRCTHWLHLGVWLERCLMWTEK